METHISFEKTNQFWQRVGYVNVHYVEARGHSGGIWLLKQHGSNIAADIFEVYKDTITVRLSLGNAKWFLTGNRMVYRKLDRAFADVPWCMAFPEAYVEVLCKFHSDHNPLLLRCGLPRRDCGPQPFRFEAAWITHPDYSDVVKVAWGKTTGDFVSCLQQ
ncbi:RNA-directed DNA polymerase (Reverse transcriptase), partial [Trifolium medium]|nr:RNA-directed DNA polymerase (Reverse transcriptase) [Trifolium medium]